MSVVHKEFPQPAGPLVGPRVGTSGLDVALDRATAWLWDNQTAEGYWVGRLESNSCIEAEWLMALHFMELDHDPAFVDLRNGMVQAILAQQRDDGAWQIYHAAPAGDINATVEAYAALRTAGMSPEAEPLVRARRWIEGRGGLARVRVFTRYWLALIGVWPWEKTPNIPAEVIRFPNWFAFSIYNFASWARATLMPISVLSARRPVRPLPGGDRLDELFPHGREAFDFSLPRKGEGRFSWERFFLAADKVLHGLQNHGLTPGREASVKRGLEWIIRHQDADGVWGGIQPPWIYSLMALHAEGYAHDHPVMAKGLGALLDERWQVKTDHGTYMQACVSPVWDTLLSLLALQEAEADGHDRDGLRKALDWLLSKEVRTRGDWSQKLPHTEPGGWAFEYENLSYPDVDDTGVALMVLSRYRNMPEWRDKGVQQALERAEVWTTAMQSTNGGWAAFDKDNSRPIITKIPFSDFGEAVDPPSVDVTAHVLEGFGLLDVPKDTPSVQKALAFIRERQRPDGSWFGRWGVNYVYGTAAVLPALRAIGEDMDAAYVHRAADWLVAMQNPDGGWGESCASYMDPTQSGRCTTVDGKAVSTASQTAWALIGLVAADRPGDLDVVRRGVQYLIGTQEDGTWEEPHYTGTGFPGYGFGDEMDFDDEKAVAHLAQGRELGRGFMINYNLYRHYFPVMALGRARRYLARHG
jgi:squalene-hopene/tetraprenyl-beta-curcumene cyclase